MIEISYIVKSNHWPRRIAKIKKIVNNILKKKVFFKFKKNENFYFNFILMNDKLIKKYNKLYKNKNLSTDVLTFVSKIKKNGIFERHFDIMFSGETILQYAKRENKSFYDHFAHLVIHSLLHIQGYNHQNNKNFLKMQKQEIKFLSFLKISNPY
tara:strand:- start:440 stop:901 length:462 start_codon:yes stop_codon:yes gene_type:complete